MELNLKQKEDHWQNKIQICFGFYQWIFPIRIEFSCPKSLYTLHAWIACGGEASNHLSLQMVGPHQSGTL